MIDLSRDKQVSKILTRLKETRSEQGPVCVDGTWGSFAPLLAVHLSEALKRPILYISAHIDDADNVADDLSVFGAGHVEVFPVWEGHGPQWQQDATDEVAAHRLRISLALSQGTGKADLCDTILSAGIQALIQPVPDPTVLSAESLNLVTGQTIEPEKVTGWLTDQGFERVDSVDVPGQFARRGGIIDIFAPVTSQSARQIGRSESVPSEPYRIEFFGEQVESIRAIDLDTQRSARTVDRLEIVPPTAHENLEQSALLLNLLPPETILLFEEPTEIAEVADVFLNRIDDPRGLYPFAAIYQAARRFTCLEISRFAGAGAAKSIHLAVTSAQQYEHKAGALWKDNKEILADLLSAGRQVYLYCENAAEVDRITEIVRNICGQVPDHLHLPIGFLHRGFILESLDTVVISHHEIFGQTSLHRRIRTVRSVSPVHTMLDLQKGDYVVHVMHGIGKFVGVELMEKAGSTSEYLTLEYADKVRMHVPVSSIHLVQKYIGAMPKRPVLSRIGSKKWERQKQRVADGVHELAAELLETQARREGMGGYAFADDSLWQKEFEESFLYQETPDQLTAAAEIKSDMQKRSPMDRLLCGDVGYGKTELAMRAAFKAVEAGKQVAVLTPTTVLSVQHGRTFTERFADFPVTVEVLNRFITAKEAKDILTRCRQGRVDILIGTHRLLSDDVGFKDLGLLIIDEEQRFGVEHKERLKRFRTNVDILTMTATPIPRTLHMSLLGLRDISSLTTPPLDRRAIVTRVNRYDRDLIRKAILHELARDGQVFFLHNRVQTIRRAAEEIRTIIDDPNVRIDIAHGQMPKHELEDAMIRFVTGATDVLVCSTIIESGLDIPNANTMVIHEADRFGLAQLHQLRGRVGRYKHRAYAYLLLPAQRSISPVAAKRLKAIEEYSQLGAGFRIALRDLEIRGAGNILGPEQSGHINTVGYELYCRLLSDAVKRLKDQPIDKTPDTVVELGFSTYIPRRYIPSDRQRMDVYRRITAATTSRDLDRLGEELDDVFGKVPSQVRLLLDLAEIRVLASAWDIRSILVQECDLIFSFGQSRPVADLFARAPGRVSIPDPGTVYLRLEKNRLDPPTLLALLRKMLAKRRSSA
ncbi:MAG: transcription-repair coupling factor [Sedimentisphaerales bacterium]|nr:transcription-repair coupling factor [Sedimentisphaerales bacterium]